MVAVLVTDVHDCETSVLLFGDVAGMAAFLTNEFRLLTSEREKIEDEQEAVIVPDKGEWRLGNDDDLDEWPRGTLTFAVVDVEDHRSA